MMMLLSGSVLLLIILGANLQLSIKSALAIDANTVIKLSNGSIVTISSLDDYLARSSDKSTDVRATTLAPPVPAPGPTEPANLQLFNSSSVGTTPKPIPQHYQVRGLLNVTHDYPLAYSRVICGYIWPLMALITLFTNLMIVSILTQRDMRTPTNVVLIAIAIADIIPIIVPVPWFIYLFAMENEKQVLYPPLTCYLYHHSTRSVSEVFYFVSTWLNLLLAVQDYLTAAWPKLAAKYCRIKVVIIEVLILTLLAFLLNLPQALKLIFKPVKFVYNGQVTWGCRAFQARWFKDLVGEYAALYDDIFTAIIVIFVDGGPAVALITLTALLIRQLQKQRIHGHKLMEQARTASKRRRERHRQQEYEASARVMIFVLIAFLAVKIPFATTYTLMIIQSRFEIHFVENLVDFQKAITITDLVFVLSYPLNFTIFCCCSKKFRHKCVQILAECSGEAAKSRFLRSFSESNFSDTQSITNNSLGKVRGSLASQLTMPPSDPEGMQSLSFAAINGSLHEAAQHRFGLPESSPICAAHDAHQRQISTNLNRLVDEQELRMIAAEGKLCLECIRSYEIIKRSPASSIRRVSNLSQMSWPSIPPLPPPPRALNLSNYENLPQIITTSCESPAEASPNKDKPEQDHANSFWSSTAGAESTAPPSDDDQSQSSFKPSAEPVRDGAPTQLPQKARSFQGSTSRFNSELGRVDHDRISRTPPGERRSSGDDEHMARLDKVKMRSGSRRFLSGSAQTSRQSDRNGILDSEKPKSGRLSLSLSHSKLSTLPNATGLLADILLTTLMPEVRSKQSTRSDPSRE